MAQLVLWRLEGGQHPIRNHLTGFRNRVVMTILQKVMLISRKRKTRESGGEALMGQA